MTFLKTKQWIIFAQIAFSCLLFWVIYWCYEKRFDWKSMDPKTNWFYVQKTLFLSSFSRKKHRNDTTNHLAKEKQFLCVLGWAVNWVHFKNIFRSDHVTLRGYTERIYVRGFPIQTCRYSHHEFVNWFRFFNCLLWTVRNPFQSKILMMYIILFSSFYDSFCFFYTGFYPVFSI